MGCVDTSQPSRNREYPTHNDVFVRTNFDPALSTSHIRKSIDRPLMQVCFWTRLLPHSTYGTEHEIIHHLRLHGADADYHVKHILWALYLFTRAPFLFLQARTDEASGVMHDYDTLGKVVGAHHRSFGLHITSLDFSKYILQISHAYRC